MRLFDAHTHLNTAPLLEDWQGYLQKFIDAGGVGLVNSGASEDYNIQGIAIATLAQSLKLKAKSGDVVITVKASLGWHPLECVEGRFVESELDAKMQWLKDLYLANKEHVVAIGETGIDVHYPNGPETLELQKELFHRHCKLAQALDLPLVIHSRDAFQETLEVLSHYTDLTIYFHCRGYGPEEFKMLNVESGRLGWRLFVGFCGNVTYKNAQALRDTLSIVPLEQILLETDAPYLTPQAVRGQSNEPAFVKYVYEYVAEYLKIDQEILSAQVEKNFMSVYKL